MLPIFDVEGLPPLWKGAMCLILTVVLFPTLGLPAIQMPAHPFGLLVMILGEIVLGLTLGLSVQFFFASIQCGGESLAMQMGFTMITFADPISGNNTGLVAHFLYMIATLTFLALNGHLYLLKAFAATFQTVPAGGLVIREILLTEILKLSAMVFTFGIRIASPILAVLFMTEVALGLLTRAAPQIHIMELGFPLKIGIAFFFLSIMFTIISDESVKFINGLDGMFFNILRAMRPI